MVEIFEGTEGKPAGEVAVITQWVEGVVRSVGSRHCWARKNKRESVLMQWTECWANAPFFASGERRV